MKQEEVFKIFRETNALLSGHFELRSGLHSDQFFQCALVLQYPQIAEKLCKAVVDKMRAEKGHTLKVDGVISPALGGIPVGHEMGRALNVKAIFAEKQDNKLVLRRAFEIKPGQHFVVAEDVITRGSRWNCRSHRRTGGPQRWARAVQGARVQPAPVGAHDVGARQLPDVQAGQQGRASRKLIPEKSLSRRRKYCSG